MVFIHQNKIIGCKDSNFAISLQIFQALFCVFSHISLIDYSFVPFLSSDFFLFHRFSFLFFRSFLLLSRLQTTKTIYPSTPPIVFSRISSTSKHPTFVISCINSTQKVRQKLQNNVLKKLLLFPAIAEK